MNCLNGMSFHLRYGFIFGGIVFTTNTHSGWMLVMTDLIRRYKVT
jgi:hypothetical protein